MDEHNAPQQQRRDTDYEETVAPENPPNSMVRPGARTKWWLSSFGVVTAVFLLVVIVFVVVMIRNEANDDRGLSPEPQAAPTSGETSSPGGFDPAPQFEETEDELEFRGGGQER